MSEYTNFSMVSMIMGWIYNLIYRGRAPWEMDGPRPGLVELVESGRLKPSRAIDLGCGTGENVIYLAQHGFEVVGVDISSRAINQAREKARTAGVDADFVVGDVTDLRGVHGAFDLVLDYGCLGCVMWSPARARYVQTLLRLTQPGSIYLLMNFVEDPNSRFHFIPNALKQGELERLLGRYFSVDQFIRNHARGPLGLEIEFRRLRRMEVGLEGGSMDSET
jgi:ubiquinone/menaquinone biosynthesis C-methylase UbiE